MQESSEKLNGKISKALGSLSEDYQSFQRTYGSIGRTFENYDTNIHINSDFDRRDYDYFRPSSRLPVRVKDKIKAAMRAYEDIGIVSNVINIMSEFGCDGIKLTHETPNIQRFYEKWFERINGYIVSERFLNYLYRTGNVFCTRKEAKITPTIAQKWKSVFAFELDDPKVKKRNIPIKYIFRDPRAIEIITDNGIDKSYGLRVSYRSRSMVLEPKNQPLYPEEVVKSLKAGDVAPLRADDLIVYFYKKDDWDDWARPMVDPIISNLITLDKMHLADISALDGAISNIRLWKFGIIDPTNPANSIIPTRKAINKLASILHNRGTGGVLDLIWDASLDFKESSTSVHQFLGSAKYEQNMREIYAGLGITPSLLGDNASSGVGSTSFISLQTLIKRLEYGRRLLVDFWQKEIKRVQIAMGFSKPAKIKFAAGLLNDEGVQNKLMMDLIDRNVISSETALSEFGFDYDLEKSRISKEESNRDRGKVPPKAGPYHNPQFEERFKEILLQGGGVAPSEVGVELEERKDGEKSMREILHEMQKELGKGVTDPKKPTNDNGRPKGANDTKKRKQKVSVKPAQAFIERFIWANQAQNTIASIIEPAILQHYSKKNMRSLTANQKDNAENLKFAILSNLEPFSKVDERAIMTLSQARAKINPGILSFAKILCQKFISKNDRQPTTEEVRQIQASSYAIYYEEIENE